MDKKKIKIEWNDRRIVNLTYPVLTIGAFLCILINYLNIRDYTNILRSYKTISKVELNDIKKHSIYTIISLIISGASCFLLICSIISWLYYVSNSVSLLYYINHTSLIFTLMISFILLSSLILIYNENKDDNKVVYNSILVFSVFYALFLCLLFIFVIRVCIHIKSINNLGLEDIFLRLNKDLGNENSNEINKSNYKIIYKSHDGKSWGANKDGSYDLVLVPIENAKQRQKFYDDNEQVQKQKVDEDKQRRDSVQKNNKKMLIRCMPLEKETKDSGNEYRQRIIDDIQARKDLDPIWAQATKASDILQSGACKQWYADNVPLARQLERDSRSFKEKIEINTRSEQNVGSPRDNGSNASSSIQDRRARAQRSIFQNVFGLPAEDSMNF